MTKRLSGGPGLPWLSLRESCPVPVDGRRIWDRHGLAVHSGQAIAEDRDSRLLFKTKQAGLQG